MKRAGLVFVPTPAVGHLVSTIEFSKRMLNLSDRFSVIILVMKSPFGVAADQPNTSQPVPAASHTHIKLIHLPTVDPPTEFESVEKFLGDYIDKYKNHVKDTIINQVLPNTSQIAGVIVDMFCTTMIDVAHELKVPSFVFFTSGAAFLGLLLYLQKRYDQVGKVFEESDPDSIVPSYINPVPTNVMPGFAFNNGGYISFANHARRFKETKGIIINTLVELESHAVHSLFDGNENEQSQAQPHVYAVGPLVDIKGKYEVQSNLTKVDKIMKWLDEQSPKSVVFLCFGSSGSFDETQLKEMAIGLEQSGQRFLWSVRQNPPKGTMATPGEHTNYDDFLPHGFSERTKGMGMWCGWAPQVEVLSHRAIGGFVSHCGWNSILESLWFGVPIVTWPLYAEQQLNAFQMTRDLGLGVELSVIYRKDGGDFVTADEIERALRRLMEGDGEIRKRVQEMSGICRKAVDDGGSSSAAFGSLIEVMLASLKTKSG
ncbi:putative flavonol 3-O-glucosyltransferase [Rosa chinensis]|uniref:Glycosyltransferase n=1 Tax=Rosa chinensis TaxID=74649 RepID=A0A2P6S0P0_ROSCH|nr:anthocyanidin 3-O-glucosyltransferase 2 [Rosa chinensis]PRQ52231.1 putative flavonol 3-O-glucosyltransferase [Rosa chinensis]